MSNTIQIKRGSGKPTRTLLEGELGLDKTNGYLYAGYEGDSHKIKAGYADTSKRAYYSRKSFEALTDSTKSYYACISLNDTKTWMGHFTIRLYCGYQFYEFIFGGYNYKEDGWYNPSARMIQASTGTNGNPGSIKIHYGYYGEKTAGKLWLAVPIGGWGSIEVISSAKDFSGTIDITIITLNKDADFSVTGGTVQSSITRYRPYLKGDCIPISDGGTGATTAVAARTNLGLGSVATLSNIPIEQGGTGATTAAAARENLGITLANLGGLPLTGGTISVASESNISKWPLVIHSSYGDGTITNWSAGIKFLLGNSGTPERYAGISAYGSSWANQTGIRLITNDASKSDTKHIATFYQGVFTAPTLAASGLGGGKVLISRANTKEITESTITSTELGYLSGATSNIQTQINNAKTTFQLISSSAGQTLNSSNSSFTVELGTTAWVAYLVMGYTTGDTESKCGHATVLIPDSMIGTSDKQFVISDGENSKSFYVKKNGTTLTFTNRGYRGGGTSENSIKVYGIK